MLVFSMQQILTLGRVYCEATGINLAVLGRRSAENWKLFPRLEAGHGCSARAAEQLTRFFVFHWPADTPWPEDVPDLRLRFDPPKAKTRDDAGVELVPS
jgi:hypothetical protein